jgi:Rrf2 family protein
MNLQKTTQYALKILGFMALHEERSFSADQLYVETRIPRRYLRRLMTDLSKAGFIMSSRGRNGGFSFARDISGISLLEIINRMEEDTFREKCILGFTFCILDTPCMMHDEWVRAKNETVDVLRKTTLGSLREKYQNQVHLAQYK